jgi:hypothetical protein
MAALVANAIPAVVAAPAGLLTMADLPFSTRGGWRAKVTTILERYQQLHPRSAALHEEALRFFPTASPTTSATSPPSRFMSSAPGSKKWDVDTS